jgi:hypothetical protein
MTSRTRTRKPVQLPAPALTDSYREIPEFPGFYATEHGQIFELRGDQLNLLKPYPTRHEQRVGIAGTNRSVHRLVLQTFRPQPKFHSLWGKHLDGNKQNCNLSNLVWVSSKHEAFPIPTARLTEKQVHQICKLLASRTRNTQSLAAEFGVTTKAIYDIANGHSWRHIAREYFHVIE